MFGDPDYVAVVRDWLRVWLQSHLYVPLLLLARSWSLLGLRL